MTLTQDHADHVFQCDGKDCHETLETGTSNFKSALNMLLRSRWKPRMNYGTQDWDHFCPGCQGSLL